MYTNATISTQNSEEQNTYDKYVLHWGTSFNFCSGNSKITCRWMQPQKSMLSK